MRTESNPSQLSPRNRLVEEEKHAEDTSPLQEETLYGKTYHYFKLKDN